MIQHLSELMCTGSKKPAKGKSQGRGGLDFGLELEMVGHSWLLPDPDYFMLEIIDRQKEPTHWLLEKDRTDKKIYYVKNSLFFSFHFIRFIFFLPLNFFLL